MDVDPMEKLEYLKLKSQRTGVALLKDPHTEKAGQRILDCMDWLRLADEGPLNPSIYTHYCKHRQCSICQDRRSRRTRSEMHQLFDQNPELAYGNWLYVTLTVRDCKVWSVRETLLNMTQAYQRLTRREFWQENVIGAIRFTEVGVGKSEADTGHPHFHCLLLVRPSMYAGKNYMSQERWTEAWQSALQEAYAPNVDVRRISGLPEEIRRQVIRAAGYSAKVLTEEPSDQWLITITQEVKSLNFLQCSGLLRALRPQLSNEDVVEENGKPIQSQPEDNSTFRWNGYTFQRYPV